MSAPRRWIRLDVGWDRSDWLAELSPGSRLAWVLLLGYVKAFGVAGAAKAMTSRGAARDWNLPEADFLAMIEAAIAHGAVVKPNEETWEITGWDRYQQDGAAERQRRHRADRSRLSPLRDVTPRHGALRSQALRSDETLTLTETDTSTPMSAVRGKKRKTRPAYTPDFLRLWSIHGRGPKPEAFEAFRVATFDGSVTTEQLEGALFRYVREKVRPDFQGVHLFRWLRDERWEEYANGNGSHPKANRLGSRPPMPNQT